MERKYNTINATVNVNLDEFTDLMVDKIFNSNNHTKRIIDVLIKKLEPYITDLIKTKIESTKETTKIGKLFKEKIDAEISDAKWLPRVSKEVVQEIVNGDDFYIDSEIAEKLCKNNDFLDEIALAVKRRMTKQNP